jgi:hypothetical protein
MLNAFTDEERAKLAQLGHIAAGYFTTKVETTMITGGTYEKVNATFTVPASNGFVWNAVDKRWDYSGPNTIASIFATFTGSHNDTVAAHVCSWKFYKNGVAVPSPPASVNIDKNDSNSVTLMAPAVSVTDGDYIEIYAVTEDTGDKVGTENMNFLIR